MDIQEATPASKDWERKDLTYHQKLEVQQSYWADYQGASKGDLTGGSAEGRGGGEEWWEPYG